MIDCNISLLGDDAVCLRPADRAHRHALAQALRTSGRWLDVVPGKEVVAVRFDPFMCAPSEAVARIKDWLKGYEEQSPGTGRPIELTLDTSSASAPDLEALAQQNNLSTDAFLQKVIESDLVVDMLGFTPGFAYVDGVDTSLVAERLSVPRVRVPAGSVGLLSGQVGLYALGGPGGWPIIGRVHEMLFDAKRHEPFLLQAGQPITLKLVAG
ncbi:MAG: carboxyltransferase domain-containing protein [Hyphomonas sp.]|nr:carboxyltransferase domain-containing protein [Hyphomonas sp.]